MQSEITPFLQIHKVKTLKRSLEPHHVFGLGVSWSKKEQRVTSVRLIVRDTFDFSSFKKFANTQDEKAVVNFFDELPTIEENPADGLHGKVFALKIASNLDTQQAYYRRLASMPVSFEGREWYKYEYEPLSEYHFPRFNLPDDCGDFFKAEIKQSFSGEVKGLCLYPKYSKLKEGGSMSVSLSDFFDTNLQKILEKYPEIWKSIFRIGSAHFMVPVSLGESDDAIKCYFVDFAKERKLLEDV